MSTWGEGNFESDFACDYLTEVVFNVIKKIKGCFDELKQEDSMCGEAILMPSVDLLITLAKAYPDVVEPLIEDEPITTWESDYLAIFDEQFNQADEQFRNRRRYVIVETFYKLKKLIL